VPVMLPDVPLAPAAALPVPVPADPALLPLVPELVVLPVAPDVLPVDGVALDAAPAGGVAALPVPWDGVVESAAPAMPMVAAVNADASSETISLRWKAWFTIPLLSGSRPRPLAARRRASTMQGICLP
jgi:hypothetical protein